MSAVLWPCPACRHGVWVGARPNPWPWIQHVRDCPVRKEHEE